VKRSASKESIERAARAVAKDNGRTIKAQVALALDGLRACGAVRTTTYAELTEYEAQKALEAG
jgi:hypothetical protein